MKVIDFIVYNFSELEFYSPNYTYILCIELKAYFFSFEEVQFVPLQYM